MTPRIVVTILATSVAIILLPGTVYGLARYQLMDYRMVSDLIGPVCFLTFYVGYPLFLISFVCWLVVESRQDPPAPNRVFLVLFGVGTAVIVAFASTGNFVGEFLAG